MLGTWNGRRVEYYSVDDIDVGRKKADINGIVWIYEECQEGAVICGAEMRSGADIAGEVAIPLQINGSSVVTIANDAFAETGIIRVEVPASVVTIGSGAFRGCAFLRNVIMRGDVPSLDPNGTCIYDGCPLDLVTRVTSLWTGGLDTWQERGVALLSTSIEMATGEHIHVANEWLNEVLGISDYVQAASPEQVADLLRSTAANGVRTVAECYALGIDPADPEDDFRITKFEIKDGRPEVELSHTKDGLGNSFEPRIKTLGKTSLSDTDWIDITDKDQSTYRFFKVDVEMP